MILVCRYGWGDVGEGRVGGCSRQVGSHVSQSTSESAILTTFNGRYLDQEFPMMLPPLDVQPHPFASHGVNEWDWNQ